MTAPTRQGDVTIFELGREYDALDVAHFEPFAAELLAAAKSVNPPLLLLDFSHTSYIGSSFIEMLVRAWKRLNERGGRLALCGVSGFCQDVFVATRLDSLWPICDDRDTAIALLQEPATS
jgi:anti-anti-sigma factor